MLLSSFGDPRAPGAFPRGSQGTSLQSIKLATDDDPKRELLKETEYKDGGVQEDGPLGPDGTGTWPQGPGQRGPLGPRGGRETRVDKDEDDERNDERRV